MNNLTIQQIYLQILAQKALEASLNGLNNPSQTAIWNMWAYITAVAIWAQTQLWAIFQSETEAAIAAAPAWTNQWLQNEAFQFQYSDTIPQVVQLNSAYTPYYATVNSSYNIISQCAVNTLPDRTVSVLVATGSPPSALNSTQLISLQGYMETIAPAGIQISCNSYPADQVYVSGNLYYNAQYAATIQAAVVQSINNYFTNIEFDGYLRTSTLESYILATSGVTDWECQNLAVRADSIPFSAATYLVQNYTEIYNKYQLFAGYCIPETTGGYVLPGTINFEIGS